MIRLNTLSTCTALALLLSIGCSKTEEKPTAATDAAVEEKVESKPLGDLFPSKSVQLPPPLAKLTFGMSDEEAEKSLPGITTKLVDLPGYAHLTAGSNSKEKGGKKFIRSLRLSIDKEAGDIKKLLTEKWGTPRTVKDLSSDVSVWFNPEDGIRAELKDGFGDGKDLEFSAYLPFEQLIGKEKGKFGFEDTPLLGLDLAGLNEHYGDVLEVLTKEEATKKRAELEKFMGKKLPILGESQGSTDIHLLPTELESFTTTVWPRFDKKTGTIESVRMTVPYKPEEGAAEKMMAVMTAAWGEPKEEEKYGQKMFVFSENPFVTVKDSIGRSWEIEMSVKR